MMLKKREEARSKSNFLRRRRVARTKDPVARRAPNGPNGAAAPRRRRV
jgi:hypothetical protein